MAHLGTGIEYALHCLLWLARPLAQPLSSRDLAELQGVPPALLAKIFSKLEKAGIVAASAGVRGGYRMARLADQITILDVVDAIDGRTPLFACQEIRGRCALFGGAPPAWSTGGVCGIHAAMLRAEAAMRAELTRTTIAMLAAGASQKAPAGFTDDVQAWLAVRDQARVAKTKPALRARDKNKGTE